MLVHEQTPSTLDFLLRLGDAFASSADERAILGKLAQIAVPAFADRCSVHLVRSDGTIENIAVAGDSDASQQMSRFSRAAPDAAFHDALRTKRVQFDAQSVIVAPIVVRDSAIGAIRFVSTSAARRYHDDDATIANDVSRRAALAIDNARSRAEAMASSHSRDLFLATLSHEMKTPLTSILGWTRMLRADGRGSELFTEALEAIEQSAKVQQRLIDDLLDVSRIITGKLHLEFAPVDVRVLLENSVETLAPRAREQGQHIHLTWPPNASIYGDEMRLRQVLWNLLTNAMKFTPSGGLIELAASANEEAVTISVIDTGRGIRPEVLPHVFDRFHQATVADRAKHGGLGLGLAIVRSIVELHGGRVEAQSAGEGKGATFSVHLPPHHTVTNNEGDQS